MSTPFDLQPDVVAQIRPMMSIDISRVAMLHHADMGNSLWAQLGLGFLTNLYTVCTGSFVLVWGPQKAYRGPG